MTTSQNPRPDTAHQRADHEHPTAPDERASAAPRHAGPVVPDDHTAAARNDAGVAAPHAALPPAELSRRSIRASDGVELSLLIATPGPGITPAADRPPILALHGFASSIASGWGRTGHLDALTRAGRTVVGLDIRGHGHSGKPHDVARYTLGQVLDDIASVAADLAHRGMTSYPSGPFDMIGYSLGARLAWTAAGRGTVPVRRMVLGGFDGRPLFQGVDTERIERLAAGVAGNDLVALRALVRGLAGTGNDTASAALQLPVLLVAGERDPLASAAAEFSARLPAAEFLPIPGRNHISTVPAGAYRKRATEFLGQS